MKVCKRFFIFPIFLVFFFVSAVCSQHAVPKDRVYLKNGRLLEGVITEEEDSYIKINIDEVSDIKISRDSIQYIKKVPSEVIEKSVLYEQQQRELGLENYKGQWVSEDRYEKLSERDFLKSEIEQLRKEKEKILKEENVLKGTRSYKNELFKFTFNPPDSWKEIPVTDKNAVCRFQDPEQDIFTEYLEVSVAAKTKSVIDQDFIDTAIRGLENEGKGYLNKIRGFDVIKVDGFNSLKISMSRYFFQDSEEPHHQKILVYLIVANSKLYKVTFSCLVKDFNRYASLFDKSIRSFIIKDSQAGKDSSKLKEEEDTVSKPVLPSSDVSIPERLAYISEPVREFGFDVLTLKDKRIIKGTVVQESNDAIKLRVESPYTPEYTVSIMRDKIESMEWMSEENRKEKIKYEEGQTQKGLVKYYGHWVTREQRDQFRQEAEIKQKGLLDSHEADEERLKFLREEQALNEEEKLKDNEVVNLLERIRILETENADLLAQLDKQRDLTNVKLDEFLERDRQKLSRGKVAKGSLESIVKVLAKSKYSTVDKYLNTAGGAILGSSGIIITNYYLGQDPFREDWFVEISDESGDRESFPARVLEYDSALDVAIIKIGARGLTPIKIGNSDILNQGDEILSVGAPAGYRESFAAGRILSLGAELVDLVDVNIKLKWNLEKKYGIHSIKELKRKFKSDYGKVSMIQHNAITFARSNGGPLLNGKSELIGINQNMNVRGNIPVVLAPSTLSFNMAVTINSIKSQRKFSRYIR